MHSSLLEAMNMEIDWIVSELECFQRSLTRFERFEVWRESEYLRVA